MQSVGRSWDDLDCARVFRSAVRSSTTPLADATLGMAGIIRWGMWSAGFSEHGGGTGEPEFDLVGCLARLDDIAASVEIPTAIGVARSLFGSGRFGGDTIQYHDPRNSFLDSVIDRGLGLPITLSVLMIEVASRVGVELCGVGLPGHFVVGEIDGVASVPARFFDVFHGGKILDADGCRALVSRLAGGRVEIPVEAWYPATNLAIVERMLNNQRAYWANLARTGDPSALLVLDAVMWSRSCLPTIGDSERGDWMRAVAPLN